MSELCDLEIIRDRYEEAVFMCGFFGLLFGLFSLCCFPPPHNSRYISVPIIDIASRSRSVSPLDAAATEYIVETNQFDRQQPNRQFNQL